MKTGTEQDILMVGFSLGVIATLLTQGFYRLLFWTVDRLLAWAHRRRASRKAQP